MDRKEFEHIALAIRPRLLAMAITLIGNDTEAEDAVQDTLLKMWTIRERLLSYRSSEALGIVMVRNFCIDRLRKSGITISSIDDDSVIETRNTAMSAEEQLIEREEGRRIHYIISQLPDNQRRVLRMRHEEEMEISEISAATGITEGNVRTILSRARSRIKELFFNQNTQ